MFLLFGSPKIQPYHVTNNVPSLGKFRSVETIQQLSNTWVRDSSELTRHLPRCIFASLRLEGVLRARLNQFAGGCA